MRVCKILLTALVAIKRKLELALTRQDAVLQPGH
jgi:hypothetical protein